MTKKVQTTSNANNSNVLGAASSLYTLYMQNTASSLKIIDVYMAFIMISGIIQFVYVCAVGTFPYNAFLAGFISTVGSFVFAGE
jgi:oligosaccharyltransferase complex subunit epsilon